MPSNKVPADFNTGGFLTAKFDSDWSSQDVEQKVSTHNVCRLLYLLQPGNENDTMDRRMEGWKDNLSRYCLYDTS